MKCEPCANVFVADPNETVVIHTIDALVVTQERRVWCPPQFDVETRAGFVEPCLAHPCARAALPPKENDGLSATKCFGTFNLSCRSQVLALLW